MYSIKAHAKVNIFLKITGHRGGYHTLLSRFMRVEALYDTITFEPCVCDTFTIEGCEGVPLESNTIYRAYQSLKSYTQSPALERFFTSHKVVVTKRIPSQAGLGGEVRMLRHLCASAMRYADSNLIQRRSRSWAAR
ncbi:hypothetical protein [Sulfurovum mangrovi]|uniref:hypothetical protein n=1 Tax=Sulfurovum mangrovi TaxID=2893889 RepID=UPI001E5678A7|nr:hypothetical protein [Sulfurovum mangrovi]UFH60721.1 hypothetical protein LN246_14265 [Sulfurovum mangrovi]